MVNLPARHDRKFKTYLWHFITFDTYWGVNCRGEAFPEQSVIEYWFVVYNREKLI